jgi:hypothetical protein
MIRKTMPTITRKETLTNQELLQELEKRVQAGTINLDIDTQRVDNQADEVPETKIFGLNKTTLLLGIVLVMGCLVFYQSQKTNLPVLIKTTVKINEASTNHE